MKRRILAMLMSLVLMIGILPVSALAVEGNAASNDLNIGVFWYDFSDAYLSQVRSALDHELGAAGMDWTNYDAFGTQATQNDQIDTAISQGANLLIVNIVDTAAVDAAQAIVDKAAAAEIPVIFFNREVEDCVINTYENACFIGAEMGMAGGMQGKMAADYILENYDEVDLNDDGQISYIMMKGELGNPEAEARTRYAVEFCNNALIEAEKPELVYYDENNADRFQPSNWSKTTAFELMETALSTNPMDSDEPIEVVFANNDDAAIGCIYALNNAGWNTGEGKSIPVFGIDCTADAMAAMEAGKMTGSVLQSAEGMAETITALAGNVVNGENVFANADDNFVVDTDGTAKIRVPHEMILEGKPYETDFDYEYEYDYEYDDGFEYIGCDVAVFWYDFSDAWLSNVRVTLDEALWNAGVSCTNYDAARVQATQNDQIDTAIAQGADALIVNIVDTAAIDAAQAIVDKAAAADIPVIFFNREVSDSVINSYENACFVGTRAAEAGEKQGILAGQYIAENYDTVDLNGDGKISYIMMKGELGNPEAEARTQYSVEFANDILEAAGKPALEYYDPNNYDKFQVANWSWDMAFDLMTTALDTNPMDGEAPIEVVFANNDDAALGSIAALNNEGWNTGDGNSIPVFGIDCTADAVYAIEEGRMTGTIRQSVNGMAETITVLINNVANGNQIFDGADEMFNVDEGTAKIRVPFEMITIDNLPDDDDDWGDDYEVPFGECGDNLTWEIDENNVLTISGEGDMWDYPEDFPGWHNWYFETVVIEDGVTSIGEFAFYDCYFNGITIPASVSNIEDTAFFVGNVEGGIWVDEANENYSSDENGILFNKDQTELVFIPNSIYGLYRVPVNVETIKDYVGGKAINMLVFEGDAPNFEENALAEMSGTAFYPENNDTWTEDVFQSYGGYITWQSYDPENPDFTVYGQCGDNLTWAFDENGTLTISGEGEMWSYDEEWPTWMPYSATIKNIVIEDGVTSIGAYAFEGLYLNDITIPASVARIAPSAFNGCYIEGGIWAAEESNYYCSDENGILFEEDMEMLLRAPSVFYGDYVVPEGVCAINEYAFAESGLTGIIFPDSLTSIGAGAFQSCWNLTNIYIPAKVAVIGDHAFAGCSSIVEFAVDEENEFYSNDEYGVLFNKDKTELLQAVWCLEGTYEIPEGVETIADNAFDMCYDLNGVIIPNTVTYIGDHAFANCYHLTNITLPESVRFVNDYAFENCDRLSKITVEGDYTTLSEFAFEGCWGLSKIIFEGNAPRFFGFNFYWPDVRVYYPEGNETWTEEFMTEYDGWAAFISYDPSQPIPSEIIDSGECGNSLFWTLNEDGLLTIFGEGDMYDYEESVAPWSWYDYPINTIVIEEGATSIGAWAFMSCTDVESITIPDTVTHIGQGAISYCYRLTEINIPASVIEIDVNNFRYCDNMTAIWVDEENANYSSDENGVLFNKDKTELIKLPSGFEGDYVVPEYVVSIGRDAFGGCSYLTSITIHEAVTYIEDFAFYASPNLNEIVVDADNEYYSSENGMLFDKDMSTLLCVPEGMGGMITIPASVSFITWAAMLGEYNLEAIKFEGDAPYCGTIIWLETTIYYPENNPTWTEEAMQSFEGYITWIPYTTVERPVGDVNGDGRVTNADVIAIARYLVDLLPVGSEAYASVEKYGDVNGDGIIKNSDLIKLARSVVEM